MIAVAPLSRNPNEQAIEVLEEMLAYAKSGQVVDLALCANLTGQQTIYRWTNSSYAVMLIGMASLLANVIYEDCFVASAAPEVE